MKKTSHLTVYVVLIFFAILFFIPVIAMLLTSVKAPMEVFINPGLIPQKVRWQNYIDIWGETNLLRMFINSSIVTTATVLLILLCASLAAFAFARLKFLGKTVLFYLILAGLILPLHAVIIPIFKTTKVLNLMNNYLALVGPYVAFELPLCLFILRNYFDTLPQEIEDAARVDGCSSFGIYWKIFLPLGKPTLAAIAIWVFLSSWNQFLLPLLFMTDKSMMPLSLAPLAYMNQYNTVWEKMFTVLSTISIPVLIAYIFLQKRFVQGLTAGAIK